MTNYKEIKKIEALVKLNEQNRKQKELEDKIIEQNTQILELNKSKQDYKAKVKFLIEKIEIIQQDLEKKLDTTLQYNDDLYQNFQNTLKENQELQNRILELEQENLQIQQAFRQAYNNDLIIKATEKKVETIEHNISRIEEHSNVIPDFEKKIRYLKEDQNQKLEIISYCMEYVETQLKKTVYTLDKILENEQIQYLINSNKCLNFIELYDVINMTKCQEIKKILGRLDLGPLFGQILERFCQISVAIANEQFVLPMYEKIEKMEKIIQQFQYILPKISVKVQEKLQNNVNTPIVSTNRQQQQINQNNNNFNPLQAYLSNNNRSENPSQNQSQDVNSNFNQIQESIKMNNFVEDLFKKISYTFTEIFEKQNFENSQKQELSQYMQENINVIKNMENIQHNILSELQKTKLEISKYTTLDRHQESSQTHI
ncbi:hypothetical protein PPERSA_07353 [Pseudocohnilembus persalinus]|uniref:Uncharacterized protein n=1 Tax=Pseudocohnilembus persalinus TaxID=266149 RepID=A0A0V0Q8P2_PSEPJ|nr:hypothetical protein PPERSA_07353 [Pseudocohnilembus persalinus]|eukprot:KRW98539.1 hypothetical protein PPERSA_07353 [Pseudocohnilembus persalinus]